MNYGLKFLIERYFKINNIFFLNGDLCMIILNKWCKYYGLEIIRLVDILV